MIQIIILIFQNYTDHIVIDILSDFGQNNSDRVRLDEFSKCRKRQFNQFICFYLANDPFA